MKNQKKYKKIIYRILVSMLISTLGLYALILSAKYFGATYNISDGDYFITWSLLSILVLNSINHVFKK
ncbi:MAG: hypothetical protein CMI94_02565 [Pelagibacteraceae bacterium]|nr:hypothetical protein [Pelagibacteraceae bacterium]|tara:strand:- start:188 stop:391 length:204 start_codon:yes stop_codon:yes gene_type:complete